MKKKFYKIVEIHPRDAWYDNRENIVGSIGTFQDLRERTTIPEFFGGNFFPKKFPRNSHYTFFAVKIEEVNK